MAGISDSQQPDDIKLHLETAIRGDNLREEVPDGESEQAKDVRESIHLPKKLRERADKALEDLSAQLPGLSAAQVDKLTATRAGRDALAAGVTALGRVDDHLQSVTGNRNPLVGKLYGVYGANPTSFAGVLRSLSMCTGQQKELSALKEDDERRDLLFTKVIEQDVDKAYADMSALVGTKASTRAELARGYTVKTATLKEGLSVLTAIRQHLYANLPNRRQDDDLIDYGFRPIAPSGGRRPKDQAEEEESDEPATEKLG
jgi:hypothetical protein